MQALISQPLLCAFVSSLIICCPVGARAQQDSINDLRKPALQMLGPGRLGAGYAAMINFAVNPDISTATFYVKTNGVDDPTLNVSRIPLRYAFTLAGHT